MKPSFTYNGGGSHSPVAPSEPTNLRPQVQIPTEHIIYPAVPVVNKCWCIWQWAKQLNPKIINWRFLSRILVEEKKHPKTQQRPPPINHHFFDANFFFSQSLKIFLRLFKWSFKTAPTNGLTIENFSSRRWTTIQAPIVPNQLKK